MGYFYGAAVEFLTPWPAYYMGKRLTGLVFSFTDNELCRVLTGGSGGLEASGEHCLRKGGWWLDVAPSNVTSSGIGDAKEARHATEFGNLFYGLLRNEREFRYATVGVECSEWIEYEELSGRLKANEGLPDGLVISQSVWEDNGRNPLFVPFSKTHLWVPWQGEEDAFAERVASRPT